MKYQPVELSQLRTLSLRERPSKVRKEDFAQKAWAGASFSEFVDSLPHILFGQDLQEVINALAKAQKNNRPIVMAMGAHVIKCGLNPVLVDLMNKQIITCLAMNGAGPIHDVEIALTGGTSEDVQAVLKHGTFGMARETGELIHRALSRHPERGLGHAIGHQLLEESAPFTSLSLLASAVRNDIPATVHVAIGTDIVHMRAETSGRSLGEASFADFRLFTSVIADLSGGVFINAGSSVILPEVFLKALTIVQNLGADLHDFTTVNIDMLLHYRPTVNVVQRPATLAGSRGFMLSGRHELLIPLLAFALLDKLETEQDSRRSA
jgi:deoxyhypusine synthase